MKKDTNCIISLKRILVKDGAVLSRLYFDGFDCAALEGVRTLIPAGVHKIEICHSHKFFRRLPLIYSETIPAKRGIRIHAGNSIADTKGCVIVGKYYDSETNRLVSSASTLNRLCSLLEEINKNEQLLIEITENYR